MKKKQLSKQLKIYTEHSYAHHTDFPPPLVHAQNPTDANIDSFSNPYHVDDDSTFYSEEWRKATAKHAIHLGGIRLYDLVFFMANGESYNDILPKLWDYSGFNDDRYERFPQWKDTIAKNRQGRAWAW